MKTARSAVPAWFDAETTTLIGRRCTACSAVFFPPTADYCRNPHCQGDQLVHHQLSDRGTVWSWTRNHYKPPAPYVAPDPFEPYVVVAVELDDDQMVVLGQLSDDSEVVEVGDRVELACEELLSEGGQDDVLLVWRWTKQTKVEADR